MTEPKNGVMRTLIQALVVSTITAAVTTYVTVQVMKDQLQELKMEVSRLGRVVHDLEIVNAELRGRLSK